MLQVFLEERAAHALTCTRRFISSGEAASPSLCQKFFSIYPEAEFHNLYGPTECAVDVTAHAVRAHDNLDLIPIGRPVANTQMYILNPLGQPVPIGIAGELYIGGVQVGRGYLNQPALSAEKFIRDPFRADPHARLYRTGDLARWLWDGSIEYLGRLDFQVKIRGFRIELGEIEQVLQKQPGVLDCVVLAQDDNVGGKRLIAYLVGSEALASGAASLREALSHDLPDYMLPSAFIPLSALPLNHSGKVDRKALPRVDAASLSTQRSYVAPRNELEERLSAILSAILGIKKIGVFDNYFELGGDSIQAIRVVSSAVKHGLPLTVAKLFEYQTIAEMARNLDQVQLGPSSISQDAVEGSMSLLPIQNSFFTDETDTHHYNQSVLLETEENFSFALLPKVIEALYERHDALRLCFKRDGLGVWQAMHQTLSSTLIESSLEIFDLPVSLPQEDLRAMSDHMARVQASLCLETGPLLKIVYYSFGQGPGRLHLVIHHLVVDGVSWRILLGDLEQAYKQAKSGLSIQLGLKSSSYQTWSERLLHYGKSEDLEKEKCHWRSVLDEKVALWPLDYEDASDVSYATTDRISLALSDAETESLLKNCHRAYHTRINDLLLVALYQSLVQWTGNKAFRIDLEGHGREAVFADMDLSQTVGWFTTLFPILLEGLGSIEQVIKTIKEQIRAVPNNGLGYGLLSHTLGISSVSSPIVFNYLGQFDQDLKADSLFRVCPQDQDGSISPKRIRKHQLSFNGWVSGGRLSFSIDYSKSQYKRETIDRLARLYVAALQSVIQHCLAKEHENYTPSDFPLAKVDQVQLDRWQLRFPEIEDLYGSTPMQQGMLFHSLLDKKDSAYITQVYFSLKGKLNQTALQMAWHHLIQDIAIFRTVFVGMGDPDIQQLVVRKADLPWRLEDWRHLSRQEQVQQFKEYCRGDRIGGFDFETAPLMRLALFRQENDFHRLLWTHHHALLDGWCLPIVLSELMRIYKILDRGGIPDSLGVAPYSRYVGWLRSQDAELARAYWSKQLGDITYATPLPMDQSPVDGRDQGQDEQVLALDRDLTSSLQQLARSSHITMNTLVTAAWGYLLLLYSGEKDVVFGSTISGRPAELYDVERMVGLFINTIPVRISFDQDPGSGPWLQEIHKNQLSGQDFGYLPLMDIQKLSAVPAGLSLFDSIIVFENYPVEDLSEQGFHNDSLALTDFASNEQTNYPLTLVVTQGEVHKIKISYRQASLSSSVIAMILEDLNGILIAMSRGGGALTSLGGSREQAQKWASFKSNNGRSRREMNVSSVKTYIAPYTVMEKALAKIWRDVLRIERISVDDNFFELGGHSLLAMQLVSRIRSILDIDLDLRAFFDAPTLAGLAERVTGAKAAQDLQPLLPIRRDQALPLSFAQARLWFLVQLAPDSVAYNISAAIQLVGALDVGALEKAVTELIRRHESLRTVFTEVNGEPVQLIGKPEPFALRIESLEPKEAVEEAIRREVRKPFHLREGLPIRCSLLRRKEQEHVLLFTMHHIVSDGWSLGVITRELTALYSAFSQGVASPQAELPIQYVDYAAWQRQVLSGELFERKVNYWKEALHDAPTALELPTDRPRPAIPSQRGAVVEWPMSKELRGLAEGLARDEQATLFMVLLAAFSILLARYSGQSDIVVGSPVANRGRTELEGLIGLFVNTLALRIDLSDNPSFRTLLKQVRATTLGGYAHQDVPFEKVVEVLALPRSMSRSPVFQVMLALQNAPREDLRLGDLKLTMVPVDSGTAKFDLVLSVEASGEGLVCSFEYSTDLYDSETIERMAKHFAGLLEAACTSPDRPIMELSLLTEAERHRILDQWNDTDQPYASESSIHQLFEDQVLRTPNGLALVFQDRRLTYSELNILANRLAWSLHERGVGAGVLVALCAERSIEMIVAIFAVLKAGGAYVPIDPSYPKERIQYMLQDSGIRLVLTQARIEALLPKHAGVNVSIDLGAGAYTTNTANLNTAITPHDLAYVIYTSGSTGQPKGTLLEHNGLCAFVQSQSEALGLDESSRMLQFASLSFDASVWEIFTALVSGASLVLAPRDQLMPGPELAQLLVEQGITVVMLPPSALAVMPLQSFPELRVLLVGGDVCPPELLRCWLAPYRRVFNAYGPTECTVYATIALCSDQVLPPNIGKPIANSRTYLLDQKQNLIPIGVIGEICIGGVGVGRGYLNRSELTAERFVPDPYLGTAARIYRTGDLGRYLHDGSIEFIGRMDQQIKVRGYRIELAEVESALKRLDVVREAVAVTRGEVPSERRLVAYYAGEVEPGEVRAKLAMTLPQYMIPEILLRLESLPLLPNGKVNRKGLPQPALRLFSLPFVAPRTPTEEQLAHIWCEVLLLDRVGIDDNFFDLGGQSLLMAKLRARVEEQFKVSLKLMDLFEYPTIAGLSSLIGNRQSEVAPEPEDDGAQRRDFLRRRKKKFDE